jgi:hypothetical protein
MEHKRGRKHPKSKEFWSQNKESFQFVRDQAFHNRVKGESICLDTVEAVAFHLALKFGSEHSEITDLKTLVLRL